MNKKTKNKVVPELRFPEFGIADQWEEYTLIKLARFRRGSFPQPYGQPEWYDEVNGTPFIQVYDVGDNFRLKPKTKSKISRLGAEQSVFIPKGTVIITIQGSIGRVAISQYDAYIDRTLLLFEEFYKPMNKTFFAYVLFLLFEIEKLKAPGGIIKTITKDVLSDFTLNIPSLEEQQKIADCLSSLDDLITAESQKLEALKVHKKGLMQQLFPAEGDASTSSAVPKLRFVEFRDSDEWKEEELGNLGKFSGGGTPSKSNESFWQGSIPWISSSDIDEDSVQQINISRFISEEALEFSATKLVPANSILIVSRVGVGKLAITREAICTSQDFTNLTPDKDDLIFLAYYIKSLSKTLLAFSQGMAIKGFTKDDISKLTLFIPKPNEQQKIADCFSSLDELIAAQIIKIEALKNHKKGLMQGLFPNTN